MKKKKSQKSKIKKVKIPDKIHEIISYLSHSFNSKVLEKEDIKQDLYVVYLEMLKKDKRSKTAEPGYFFMKFKWYLLTKYAKEVKRICREWEYKLQNYNGKSKVQSNIGYLHNIRFPKKN